MELRSSNRDAFYRQVVPLGLPLIKALDAFSTEFNIASLEPLIKQCFSDYVKRLEAETDLRKTMSSIDANDEAYRRD